MTSAELKTARLQCGLDQRRMAAMMGMSQPAYSRIESGARQPTRQQAACVALILKLNGVHYEKNI